MAKMIPNNVMIEEFHGWQRGDVNKLSHKYIVFKSITFYL